MNFYSCPCPSYPSIMNASCCPPAYPPCPPPSPPCSQISKLANFVHYGGACGDPNCNSSQGSCCPCSAEPKCAPSRGLSGKPFLSRRPPLPPCAPTCITPDCKDLPAQRLRNVDVLEELCYYVPGCDPNCAMDCYSVDCCGNIERISEGNCCEDPCCPQDPCCCPPNPVKYSRRQRFTFNEPGNGRPSYSDPWPFSADSCGGGHSGSSIGGGRSGGAGNSRCIEGKSGDGSSNPCCGGRKYTYCPEEPIDCTEMLPPESGVYYFDKERRAFVPEKDLPRPPEVLEKQIVLPDVEEYEVLEEEEVGSGNANAQGSQIQKPTIQPIVQPIIMPSNPSQPAPANTTVCNFIPPCPPPPPPQCPPPCPPPIVVCPPPPCNPYPPSCIPSCNPYPPPCNPCNPCPPPCNPCMPQCNPCMPQCNPCMPQCNPCMPQCNPCMPQCNPCCNPCMSPCNPCCNPCMPCGPLNPFMNMCGGVLPMVIPMCPQQPSGLPPPGAPPPPPFPFPPPFFKKKKKRKKSRHSGRYGYDEYSDNIIVPGAPEPLLQQMGEEVPPEAIGVEMGDRIEMEDGELPPLDDMQGMERSYPERANVNRGGNGRNVQQMNDGTIITTIDFPPGEAENVDVTATNRRNPNEPNIDVMAELRGGKGRPTPRGQTLGPTQQYTTQDGATVTTYKMPKGKDGFVRATNSAK